jgi:thiamine biosynthesis protein ThiI
MMEIASLLASRRRARCLITGESLGQVASQTIRSLAFTESTSRLPVFRPLIGMDKDEIIAMAREIGTYETSILPYPDCCTVFASPNPLTHPLKDRMIEAYRNLQLDPMIRAAVHSAEEVKFMGGSKKGS